MKFSALATAAALLLVASAFGGVEATGGAGKQERHLDGKFGELAAELKIAVAVSHDEKDAFKDIMNHLKKNPSIIDLNFKRDSDDAERRLDLGAPPAAEVTNMAHDPSRDAARNFFNHVVMPIKMKNHFHMNDKPASGSSKTKIYDEGAMEKLLKNYVDVDTPSDAIDPHRRLQLPEECAVADNGSTVCGVLTDTYFVFFFNCPAVPTAATDCASCDVISLVGDSTPDDITDNPICISCSVCSTGSSPISYDCSNEFTSGCVTLDCNGNCGGGDTSPTPSPGDTTLPDGCVTTDSGDIACGIITDSYLAVFVDCPASLSGPEDCELCDVISLIGDTTPDDVTDNPICSSCSVCASGASPFAYDCSNEFTTGCITLSCDGTCNGGTVPTSPSFSPPTPSPASTPPPPTPSTNTGLPAGCFETDQGNVGCGIVGDGYVTVFFNCPAGFSGPGDCATCQTLVDDLTPDDFTDNPICRSCTTCPTGSSASEHDCSNEISTGCVFLDCSGVCSTTSSSTTPTPSPVSAPSSPSGGLTLPDECVESDDGSVACGIITDTYFVIFFDCPTTLDGPTDCQQCEVISLVNDLTPDDITDNPLCTSCSVCTASSVYPFEYNCANEFTSADGCVTIGCDGSCGDGGGGTVATSPPTSSSESKPPTPLIIPPLKPTVAPAGSDSGTLSYSTIVVIGLMMSASVFGMFF